MDPSVVVPIMLFSALVAVIWLFQHHALKKRQDAFATLRLAIEKNQPLTPEALEAMARISSPIADLRRGIIFIAISAGFAAFATIIGAGRQGHDWEDINRALYGVAAFPLFIGLAFLGLHFFANESRRPKP